MGTTIAPRCFDDDSSPVRVASFGDASASGSLAAGVFAGHSAAIAHQLPRAVKARDLPQFSGDRHRRDLPVAFARVHPRFSTPYVALISYGAAGILFGLLGQAGASVKARIG